MKKKKEKQRILSAVFQMMADKQILNASIRNGENIAEVADECGIKLAKLSEIEDDER